MLETTNNEANVFVFRNDMEIKISQENLYIVFFFFFFY